MPVAGVVALLAAVGPAGARSAAGWSKPVAVLAELAGRDVAAHLVVAPDGAGFVAADALATNHEGPFAAVMGAGIAPDGTVQPVQAITSPGEDPYRLGLGIDAAGTVTAGYTSGNGARASVRLRERPPGGRFGPPAQLTAVPSSLVRLQVTPDGFAIALVRLEPPRAVRYGLWVRPAGGSAFRRVLGLPPGAADATASASADHRVLLAWTVPVGARRVAVAALGWRPGSRPERSRIVAVEPRRDAPVPLVGIVPGGGGLIAWQVPAGGGRDRVRAVTRSGAGRRFSPAVAVTPTRRGHDAGELHVYAGRGAVLLATNEAQGNGPYRAVLRTWTPGGGFAPPRLVSSATSDAFSPFAAAGGPRTVLAWQASSGGQTAIEAAGARGPGAFSAPSVLSDRHLIVQSLGGGPYLAVDARGVALAAWIDYGRGGSPDGQVELSRLAAPSGATARAPSR